MIKESEQIQQTITYTYTIDQFTVFFYGDHVFVGGKEYPIGQCCIDIMNLEESILDEINQRARACVAAALALLEEKTDSAAALAQEKLNAVWDIVFTLPVFRDLNMDKDVNYHTFQRLMADPEKWEQVQDPNSEGRKIYQEMLMELACFAGHLRNFQRQIAEMADRYFEPLKRRSSGMYAEAYADYCGQMTPLSILLFNEDFEQSFPMKVSFVPMMHPTEDGRLFIAEKAVFSSLTDFLRTEFYQGLAIGNSLRRCHNCGRYFLLTAGYNTCYCNNIAPGETKRTCRKVGAHRKESQGKENRTPAQKEYDRTYNRLKTRKQ